MKNNRSRYYGTHTERKYKYKLSGKKVAIFCCHGGQKGKTIEKMEECLKGNIIIGENDFLEPLNSILR